MSHLIHKETKSATSEFGPKAHQARQMRQKKALKKTKVISSNIVRKTSKMLGAYLLLKIYLTEYFIIYLTITMSETHRGAASLPDGASARRRPGIAGPAESWRTSQQPADKWPAVLEIAPC